MDSLSFHLVQKSPVTPTSKASAQTLKVLIVQESLTDGYTLDSDNQFQFRLSMPAQMPLIVALSMVSNACPGMTTKKAWSYTLVERSSMTRVTVQPVWEYPDEYCQTQTLEVSWTQPEEIAAFQAWLDQVPASSAQVPTPTPALVAPVSAPTPVAYQQQAEPATQNIAHPIPQDESSGDASRRAKQHQACLDQAKDDPSITCK